jgi:hypothetical protein
VDADLSHVNTDTVDRGLAVSFDTGWRHVRFAQRYAIMHIMMCFTCQRSDHSKSPLFVITLSFVFIIREYVAVEADGTANITLVRSYTHMSALTFLTSMSIGYSTSDLSARGVNGDTFAICRAIHVTERGEDCGDYERVAGEVGTFMFCSSKVDVSVASRLIMRLAISHMYTCCLCGFNFRSYLLRENCTNRLK